MEQENKENGSQTQQKIAMRVSGVSITAVSYTHLWNDRLSDDMKIQWLVERSLSQIAAVRKICRGANVEAVLCVTLDYDKLFQPFENIINEKCGGMILDLSLIHI